MGNPTKYPVWEVPTPQKAVEMGENSWIKFMNDREVRIANAQHDPLTYGYEPPIWRVMDALLDFNFYSS